MSASSHEGQAGKPDLPSVSGHQGRAGKPDLRSSRFERILIIKPSAMGDVIHTVPVLAKLRARYPEARIDWLLTPAIAEWIQHHPALSNVVLFERRAYASAWRSWRSFAGVVDLLTTLRRTQYDLVIDLHGQFRSAVLALATGALVRIGFDRPRRSNWGKNGRKLVQEAYIHGWTGAREGAWLAYTHRLSIPTLDVHAVDRYLWLGDLLGFEPGPVDFRLPIPVAAEEHVSRLLDRPELRGKPLAVLVPGTIWETKHWHLDGFTRVAQHLHRTGRAVVLAGSAAERGRCRTVVAACPAAVDLSGQTKLSALAALVRRAQICVTNDSGSMHLAVALDRPVVSIFGPTDPVWIGPYGRPQAVVQTRISCAPCYLRKLRDCKHGHACMAQVTADTVIERIERMLGQGLSAASS